MSTARCAVRRRPTRAVRNTRFPSGLAVMIARRTFLLPQRAYRGVMVNANPKATHCVGGRASEAYWPRARARTAPSRYALRDDRT
eukprot:7391693-Prymnesium_polylepis.2